MSIFSKRVIAYVLDFFVVSAAMWIVSFFLFSILGPRNVYKGYQYLPWVVPVLGLVYFVICEWLFGASIGKAIMKLQVRSKNGAKISFLQALIRNLTKIYWIPIIFDWLIGKLLRTDRLFNNITRTTVVND